jgi:hypothetical protein
MEIPTSCVKLISAEPITQLTHKSIPNQAFKRLATITQLDIETIQLNIETKQFNIIPAS